MQGESQTYGFHQACFPLCIIAQQNGTFRRYFPAKCRVTPEVHQAQGSEHALAGRWQGAYGIHHLFADGQLAGAAPSTQLFLGELNGVSNGDCDGLEA